MYLKELVLYGFKSFGDRVKIVFNPRLTAIVGPNGSGKSNIVDSVRWLLGDQSFKSLRVPSSEEVIFKGADTGAPFNFSHVGMVLDLDEDGEIQVERRFHRSGENEYILNSKPIRLKDIRGLLSSKGFGLGSLSILSQGQIDSILSLVPTDRRVVLEEVAQIAHFKENKTRILKKLDATRDNLTRLDDILREVDSRIKELAEQAEAASVYRELTTKRDELEVTLSFKETERLVKNIRKNLEELQEKEQELFSLKEESTETCNNVKIFEDDLEELRRQLENEMEIERERSLTFEKTRSAMDLASSELSSATQRRELIAKSIGKLESDLNSLLKEIETEKINLSESRKDKVNAESSLAEIQQKHEQDLKEENQELEEIGRRTETRNSLRTEIDFTQARLTMLEERLTRSNEYLEEDEAAFNDRSSELERISAHSEAINNEVKNYENTINSQEAHRETLRNQLNESENEIRSTESELAELKDLLIGISSELRILNDLERKLAGYQYGVKRIIEAKNQGLLNGVIGPVVDLLKVKHGFERAIEAALAGRGQYVVVETFADGLNALEYLKSTGGGRVTFIPMDDFQSENSLNDFHGSGEIDGFLGKAVSHIDVNERFEPVLDYLLKDTLIFRDLISARNARSKHNLKQWIVTLDGDIHRPKGIFTGGTVDPRSEGPLVRRSQIEELEQKKHDKETQLSLLTERLNSAKILREDNLREIKKQDEEILKLREKSQDALRERRYIDETITNLDREIRELRGKRDKITAEIEEIIGDINRLKFSMKELESRLDDAARKSVSDDERREQLLSERSLREDEINRLKIIISSREQEDVYLSSTISGLENRCDTYSIDLEKLSEDLIVELDREEQTQARYIRLKYQVDQESEKLTSEESGEARVRKAIDLKRTEFLNSREKAAELSAKIEETDARRESQSVRVAKMETELVAFLKKVADLENVKNEFPNLLDTDSEDFNRFLESEFIDKLPSRKQIVDELDVIVAELTKIGEVNVLAERDYENYKRRKEFLETQKNDLLKAADDLMETLGEIEGESKIAFKEVFDQTKANFEEIFVELFPNGKAELSLTDPTDILESGLDIKVKFPGKKELDLLQFSGGERSIIALAFLFAVLKTKPPSFVILDEVEAALDDVNVENFIKLMKKFSDKFQFIVVTHNKLTMEYARDLWGVTMKKGGMSQVISISLDDWIRQHPESVQ